MDLNQLQQLAEKEISEISDLEALEALRIFYLGRKGKITEVLRGLKNLPQRERAKAGKIANELKIKITKEIEAKVKKLKAADSTKTKDKEWIDVSFPDLKSVSQKIGHLHPISKIQKEIEDIFVSIGFMVLEGPEIESDYYNFEALNFPPDHPARDIQDTFFIIPPLIPPKSWRIKYFSPKLVEVRNGNKSNLVLRTHTSSMQVRALEKYGAPLRAIVPGKVFRYEATDASHDTTFYQVEGLMIDKDISLANLKAIMLEMLEKIFQKKIKVRFRPGFFPFTEPSLELDLECFVCSGKGCRVCKNSGWVEFMGAGMVHPNVLKYGGVDPEKFSGFAFGLGLNRLAMMKYGINDIRLFMSGDLRFLEQF